MTREMIERALARMDGATVDGDSFELGEAHHVTFYLGGPGDAMVVRGVSGGAFAEDLIDLVTEDGERVVAPLESVSALSQGAKGASSRRAGFA